MRFNKLKICIVNNKYTLTGGGGQYRVLGIARQLERFGFQVTLCCPFYSTNSLFEFPDTPNIDIVNSFRSWMYREYMNTFRLFHRFRNADGPFDFTLVELPCPVSKSFIAIYNKLVERRKTFVDIGDMWYSPHITLRVIENLLIKRVCSMVDGVSVATVALKNLLEDQYSIKKEIKYIPCGVDINLFNPVRTDRIEISERNDRKIILFSGVVSMFTGCHYLPDIAETVTKEWRDVIFGVVGDGPYLETLKKEVKLRGLNSYFLFIGRVPHKIVPSYVKAADICVALTPPDSITDRGVFPIKIVEYMAMAKPVVSTDIKEVKNILKNGYDGFYCSPSNVGKNIIDLMEDEALRRKIGERARRKAVARYSWEILVKNLLRYWGKVV